MIDLVNLTGFDEDALAPRYGRPLLSLVWRKVSRQGAGLTLYFTNSARQNLPAYVEGIGVRPGYQFELGTRAELHEQVGVGVNAVAKRITSTINYNS